MAEYLYWQAIIHPVTLMALLLSHFTTRGDTMGFRIQESSTNRIARMFASVLSEIKEIRWHKAIKAPNAHVVTLEN